MRSVFTIGHSNHKPEKFHAMLTSHGIEMLVDVRAFPRSRFNPHFNEKALARGLAEQGIAYQHWPELGGKRAPSLHSRNTAFRPDGGLQSYADYMATLDFRAAIGRLTMVAEQQCTTILCAEAKPEQCHRQLVADALLLQGWDVVHITGIGEHRVHALNATARLHVDGYVYYPTADAQLTML